MKHASEPAIKEIVWEVEHHHSSCGDYNTIVPVIREYPAADAPAALHPVAEGGLKGLLCLAPAICAALVLLLVAVAVSALALQQLRPKVRRRPAAPQKGNPRDVVVLHDLPRSPIVPGPACSQSASVEQVEAFLRFVGINYVKKAGSPFAIGTQLPSITHGPIRVEGAGTILKYLATTYGPGVEGMVHPRDPKDKAVAVAVESMAMSVLSHALLYFRWVSSQNWAMNKHLLLVGYRLPLPLQWVARALARKARANEALGLGISLLSEAGILEAVNGHLEALSTLLGSRPFLFGDHPYAVDAAVFAVLDQYAHGGLNWQLRDAVQGFPSLVDYVQRVRCAYFGPAYIGSVVWLNDSSAAGFGRVKQHAREAQCADHPKLSAARPGGAKAALSQGDPQPQTEEPAGPALFS